LENAAMATYYCRCLRFAAAIALGLSGASAAHAQDAPAFHPIPAADCQSLASQLQGAAGFAMSAAEDDFTDLADGSEGRSCHITGSASDQSFAGPADLVAKIAKVFADWRDDPSRAADGPDGAERGYVKDTRIATVDVSWEPGPGVVCSDKQPLAACKILPQQKLWNAVVDIIEKGAK
jgi:hypothetical protein